MERTPDRADGNGEGAGGEKQVEPFELAPLEPEARPAAGEGGAAGGGEEGGRGGARPPRGEIKAESVLEVREEHCPNCGAVLGPVDVVCVKCGYDLIKNEQRRVEKKVEEVSEGEGEEGREPFVTPGRGSAKLWVIVATIVTIAAMIFAGWGTPPGKGAGVVIAAILLVVYRVLAHTGTGLVAVGIAARINEQRFGGEDALSLAAARVFVAIAVFELITAALPPLIGTAGKYLGAPLGAAAYWAIVMVLFKKDRTVALVITLAQVILWVVVQLGMELSGWYRAELAS